MIVPLKKRGSITLQVGIIYEVQLFPCFIYVPQIITAQQADTELFDLPNSIVFNTNNRSAEITRKFIRVNEDIHVAIKKDGFASTVR